MNIRILKSLADIFPSFSPIETTDDPAMFQRQINTFRIFRVDIDVPHMALVRRLREIPLVLYFFGQFQQRLDIFPRIPTIFAAIQMNRFGASVNDPVIGRIHGDPANIAFQYSIPMPPGVSGAIETVESYAGKNRLRTLFTSVNGIDDLFFKVRLELPRTSHGGPNVSDTTKNDHSRLRPCIEAICFSHTAASKIFG